MNPFGLMSTTSCQSISHTISSQQFGATVIAPDGTAFALSNTVVGRAFLGRALQLRRATYKDTTDMSTAYDVKFPADMRVASGTDTCNWAESTIDSVVNGLEDYARAKPLSFAAWTFGIGFVLGWKLKPW
jgi:hypothetical protein